MAESKGSRELDRLLSDRGAQQKLAEDMGTFPSVVLRWRRGDQKPDAKNRILLKQKLEIPFPAWDEPPEPTDSTAPEVA